MLAGRQRRLSARAALPPLQDALEAMEDVREYDVPFHMRWAIDTGVRCGWWYTVKAMVRRLRPPCSTHQTTYAPPRHGCVVAKGHREQCLAGDCRSERCRLQTACDCCHFQTRPLPWCCRRGASACSGGRT